MRLTPKPELTHRRPPNPRNPRLEGPAGAAAGFSSVICITEIELKLKTRHGLRSARAALLHCAEFALEPRLRFCVAYRIRMAAISTAKHFLACSFFQHKLHAFLAL